MTMAQRQAALGIIALFALQWFWHAWLLPPGRVPPWILAGIFSMPMLPALVLLALGHRRAAYWGAIAALLYFCHGVMEAWADARARPLALAEVVLSTWLVLAYGWDGLQARLAKRKHSSRDV